MLKWVLPCLLALAACMPSAPVAQQENARVPPTAPPPLWVESVGPITLDNVARVAYLGRLDQPGTPSTVFAYSVSPDATRLAGLNNEQLLVWDLISGARVAATARAEASQVFFSADKTEIYTLNAAGVVSVFDAETTVSQNHFEAHSTYNNEQAYYQEDGWLAIGGENGEIKVWDMLERISLATLQGSRVQVSALAFSPDGARLASGSNDGAARVWDWRSRALLLEIPPGTPLQVVQVAFSPDGERLAAATVSDAGVYSAEDGALQYTLDIEDGGADDMLVFSPDGRFLLTGGQRTTVSLWYVETGELAARLPNVGGTRVSAAFSPDGTMLLTSALDSPVRLWDMTRITQAAANSAELPVGSDQIISSDWTSDSRLMLFVDATGPIHVWGIGASQD